MTNLAGLHDREATAVARPDTWVLDTVALSENPAPTDYVSSLNWITRLNWGYGSTGTLPVFAQLGEYVSRAVLYVGHSRNCSRWIVGNEPNLPREWPDGQPIDPWRYGEFYRTTREYVHKLPGHERDEVLIAASGPWNNELKYEGNPNGDWIQNFADVIKACGDKIDGFALHSYTHGYNVALVTSSARMQAPFQNRHYEFRAYRDYMEAIPDELSHLPCYITEANGNGPWQAVGLMPAMLGEIDAWNQASKQKIYAVIFYRYPKYDDFYIEGRGDVISEYHAAVARGYPSPVKGNSVTDTFIPVVNPGTVPAEPSLPPRNIDPRLVNRGVTVNEVTSSDPNHLLWKIVSAQFFNEQESGGRHHIYVEALDENGKPVNGIPFLMRSQGSPQQELKTNGRTFFDATNVPMWASEGKNGYSIKFWEGDAITGLGMGDDTPSGFNAGVHTSILVKAQQKRAGVTVPQPTQPPIVSPGPQPVPQPVEWDVMWVDAPSGAFIRVRPNASSEKVAAVAYGEPVEVSGSEVGAEGMYWSRVRYQAATGWIRGDLLSAEPPVKPEPTPQPEPQPQGDTWSRAWPIVLKIEGGLSTDRSDKGNYRPDGTFVGTKWGISALSHPTVDIVNLTKEDALKIYHQNYWLGGGCDRLEWPLCLVHFDAYVQNQNAAKKFLAASNGDPVRYIADRIDWYTGLDTWANHGRGWMRRCATMLREAAKLKVEAAIEQLEASKP